VPQLPALSKRSASNGSPARPTDDVDVIIEVLSTIRYSEYETQLRAAGFSHDMSAGAPRCRWTLGDSIIDIMPTDGAALGLNTMWFAEALATAKPRVVGQSTFNVIAPEAFLATKLIAYRERGDGDIYGSKDLEDLMTVIDGRDAG
jgi:predicted nucleotidyltransferase